MTAALAAQTPAPPQRAAESATRKIVVTGCLAETPDAAAPDATDKADNPATAAGTGGAAIPKAGDTAIVTVKFLLTGAAFAAERASGDEKTASTVTTASHMYRLVGIEQTLSQHVGEKVELIGTLEEARSGGSADSKASAPVFRVESGRTLAPQCAQRA